MTKAITRSRVRRNFWMFAFLSLTFAYFSQLGMTFNGIISLVDLQPFTLGLFGFMVILWLVTHWRKEWLWHRTPLDFGMLLWVIAFLVSLAMNPQTIRRSLEGMWYVVLYASLWYLLLDVLANGGISRQTLTQCLLFAGLIVMLFGWYSTWLILDVSGWNSIPRPGGLIGNPNAFGAFILLLIPIGFVQMIYAQQRFAQWMLSLYTISAFLLLILSQSRGAWIGFVGAMIFLIVMLLADRNLLSVSALRRWWNEQSIAFRVILIIVLIALLLAGLFMMNFLVKSLAVGGRSVALRTYLWSAAWSMFRESPAGGKGFFTYGQHLARYASIPPTQPQAHAHNVPFTVLAEIGLVGFLALATSTTLALSMMWRNWKQVTGAERGAYIASTASAIGFGIHHLLDTPAMMPVIAMTGLLVLVLAIAPAEPIAFKMQIRRIAHPIGLISMWVVLLIAGFWNSGLYGQYISILRDVTALNDCRVAPTNNCVLADAESFFVSTNALQALIDADPRQPAYILQQSYIYGLAASADDLGALGLAISGYEHYLDLEPTHASAWSNLAALYWQMGNQARARAAIEQAILYAPNWPHFKRQRDIYAGILSDAETIVPPIPALDGLNWSRLQYLREPLPEYLPQVGWGS